MGPTIQLIQLTVRAEREAETNAAQPWPMQVILRMKNRLSYRRTEETFASNEG